ncbi:unnamed protein product [Calypogeia fissa]
MVWGRSYGSSGKNSRGPAIISSLLALFFVVYLTTGLVLCPAVPSLVSKAANQAISRPDREPILRLRSAKQWSELRKQNQQTQQQQEPPIFSAPVKKLLSDLKAATRAAEISGGIPFSYTEEEQKRWRKSNPCRARSELPSLYARRHSTSVERNHEWEAVLAEYSTLHRTCTRRIANLTDYFLTGSTVPGCKFVTGESLFGLGNQITFAASVVLYGILTQRVVLFYEWGTWVPAVMCEPFGGSSWRLPYELHHLNERQQTPENINDEVVSNSTQRFLDWVDREMAQRSNLNKIHVREQNRQQIYHTEVDNGWQPVDRFFCNSEQELLSQVRWVSLAGCLYFMPKLFAVPSFRPTLEALFPDRMALTHLLRTVFLPYNVAWDRIQRQNDLFLSQADRIVSIQVRYRLWYEHSQLHDSVNQKTIQCLVGNGILPNVTDVSVHSAHNSKYAVNEGRPMTTKVLITSLETDLYDLLQDRYLRFPTVTGESVGLVQLSHASSQKWGFEPHTQALAEIILLSLSDEMLVTPLSTFGGVAQAYGGLKPWIVDHSKSTSAESCVRASSVDVCYQQANVTFSCPHDPDVHNKKVYEHVPSIERCLEIDSPSGLVLLTS